MLSLIRSLTKSWIGPVIMGIITVAFIVLGPGGAARDVLRGHIEDTVVDANCHSKSPASSSRPTSVPDQAEL